MPDRNDEHLHDSDNAVLADGGSIETTGMIGIIGGTAQVDVTLPVAADDDFDDDVVDDGLPLGATADDEAASTGPDGDGQSHADAGVVDADEAVAHGAEDAADEAPRDAAESGTAHAAADPRPAREDDEHHDLRDGTDDHAVTTTAAAATAPDGDDVVDAEVVTEPARPSAADRPAVGEVIATVVPTPAPVTGALPASRREAHHLASDRHATERVQVVRGAEVTLQSRRLGDLEPGRESSDLLTAERLLDPSQVVRGEPDGTWQRLVYAITAHRVNLGDSRRARSRKELDRRISAPLSGGARFVPVLSRKGGVGKTTVTTLLGMALADARDDRVIAIDANPDRGTLAERIGRSSGKTVRDLVRIRKDVVGFNDLSGIVARDETRLDVIASDTDPHVSEAFSDRDYHDVASIAAHYYSIVLTDTGTGIVHSVMGATLDLSDQLVVVAGMSVDEARLASETLTWLESNGFAEQVRNAVVVLNTSRPGTPLVRASELEAHFTTRVRTVLRVPYDPHLAAGSAVSFRDLDPATREAARQLAASVVEGLRLVTPAA